MKKVIEMSIEDKRFIFDTTALKMKIHPAIIEKDLTFYSMILNIKIISPLKVVQAYQKLTMLYLACLKILI